MNQAVKTPNLKFHSGSLAQANNKLLHKHTLRWHICFFRPNCRVDEIEQRNSVKGKESAVSRNRSSANIKLLCCCSTHRDVRVHAKKAVWQLFDKSGLEKANASAAGKHTSR